MPLSSAGWTFGQRSLRTLLLAASVGQIIAAVGLTGYLSFWNGQRAVHNLVGQLKADINERVRQKLTTYLAVPQLVARMNADIVRYSLLDVDDVAAVQRHLWQQFEQFNNQEFNSLTFVAIAAQSGDYVGLGYRENLKLVLDIRDVPQDQVIWTWKLNDWGDRIQRIGTLLPDLDPRQHRWYQQAAQVGNSVWVDPHVVAVDHDLLLSVDRPLYTRQGNFWGVTKAALSLSSISKFLRSINVGQRGQVFIIEPSGLMIGTSSQLENPFAGSGTRLRRVNVLDSRDPLTAATALHLQRQFGQFNNIVRPQQSQFWQDGQLTFVEIQPFRDAQGLDWLVITVLPEADFMAEINRNTQCTIVLCLVALGVAIAVAAATTRCITRPLLQLSQAADALAAGEWDYPVPLQRSDEVGSLARAFHQMQQRLKRSHDQLSAYSQGLAQTNQQLQTLEADLRRQLNLFLHAVSHDLRNPVVGTAMVLNHLDQQEGADIRLSRAVLQRMIAGNERQLALINSLLDTHAAELWGVVLQPQAIALLELVEGAIADLQPLLERDQAQLINHISAELPTAQVDPLQVIRVYQNLIANALKHNPPGLIITLNAQVEGAYLRCSVADNGVGIPAEQHERLFDPYFRGGGKSAVGLGLGLYLCQQVIQAHGGQITVQSRPGAGTCFIFTLPHSLLAA